MLVRFAAVNQKPGEGQVVVDLNLELDRRRRRPQAPVRQGCALTKPQLIREPQPRLALVPAPKFALSRKQPTQ